MVSSGSNEVLILFSQGFSTADKDLSGVDRPSPSSKKSQGAGEASDGFVLLSFGTTKDLTKTLVNPIKHLI